MYDVAGSTCLRLQPIILSQQPQSVWVLDLRSAVLGAQTAFLKV